MRSLPNSSSTEIRNGWRPGAVSRIVPAASPGAWQEQRYWLTLVQGQTPLPPLNALVGYGRPASTPPLDEMTAAWRTVTGAADAFLDEITIAKLQETITNRNWTTMLGSLLLRVIYHYWYHIGEIMSIRQQLGHPNLPDFVGDLDAEAPYRPEA